ncbi:MAG: T9SS type A sorting domain-containing protein [Flavobacteriales bacterium]|nr:T9SS type A sorting domain-containing protein [Flavobacteriales bacterium]
MKKTHLLFLALIASFTAFSQVKHVKFSRGVKFAQFNPSFQFGYTVPSEIQDNSGYFLTNHYDDQSYGFNPSMVKMDVDGTVLWDSIYTFTPPYTFGYTYTRGAVSSPTSHTALYQNGGISSVNAVAPYLINYDLNGNINWHVGFTNDTIDMESYELIATQDGGYVVVGAMYDWYFSVAKPSGFVMKLDMNGTMQWQHLYTNKDSMEISFKAGIETPDGGFFVAGDCPNFTGGARLLDPWDIVLGMAKLDNLGNMVWNQGITLDAPINNSSGFSDISVGMLNGADAFVSYSCYDSTTITGGYKFGITSLNVNTGATNWTKVYTLPVGQEVSVRKVVSNEKGQIVVTASDYINNIGVLFLLDDNGNLINSKSFLTLPFMAHFPYATIATLDGGFLHVNEEAQNKAFVIKTDQNLDPSCPNIDSTYANLLTGVVNIDTAYIGIMDSTFTLANLAPISMTLGSQFATSSDDSLVCSCSNTVMGQVTQGGVTPVNNAKVYLFRKGMVPHPWHPIDSTVTNATGNYQFDYVPTDSFIVRVEADTTLYPGALTSYFKEPSWCYRWDLAGVFSVHCDSGVVQKDVKLVVPAPLTGGSTVSGYIYQSAGSFQKYKQPGDPIPGIDITVDQSPGGIVGGTNSNGNGFYTLTGLDTSATYVITIDLPGIPHDSVWTVNINLVDSTLDSLNFYIDSTGIYILQDSFGVGVNVMQTDNMDIELYPNPNSGIFTITIHAIKPEQVELQLVDQFGKVISTEKRQVVSGENKIIFDETASLANGIYFLKISEGKNHYLKKIVKL